MRRSPVPSVRLLGLLASGLAAVGGWPAAPQAAAGGLLVGRVGASVQATQVARPAGPSGPSGPSGPAGPSGPGGAGGPGGPGGAGVAALPGPPAETSGRTAAPTPGAPPAGTPCPRIRATGPRPVGAPSPYRCPVAGALADPFDAPATRWSAGHRGVDLHAPVGAVVRAPGAGTVSFAGMVAGRPVVTVDHGGGWRTSLEPVRPAVTAGTVVVTGGALGVVDAAASHCAPATCVHLGVRHGETYVDPLPLLTRRPVVLLPLR